MSKTAKHLLPGRKGVAEVLRHRPERIRKIILREGAHFDAELSRLLAEAEQRGTAVSRLDKQRFEELVPEQSAQGIAAEVEPAGCSLAELSNAARAGRGCILVCDQINDPQNLGALMRAAEGAGVDGLLLTSDRSAGITPAVRKASAGASELLPICTAKNLQRALEKLKADGFWIVGAPLGEGSVGLFDSQDLHPLALVVGSEGSGLRQLTKKLCDVLVEIPMAGAVTSLNVSQAAAVVLYEWRRRQLLRERNSQ